LQTVSKVKLRHNRPCRATTAGLVALQLRSAETFLSEPRRQQQLAEHVEDGIALGGGQES
jgi:hypothetical protein